MELALNINNPFFIHSLLSSLVMSVATTGSVSEGLGSILTISSVNCKVLGVTSDDWYTCDDGDDCGR